MITIKDVLKFADELEKLQSKCKKLQDRVSFLEKERQSIRNALERGDIKHLKEYLFIK